MYGRVAALYCIAAKGIEYVTLQIDVESMHTARATKSFSWQKKLDIPKSPRWSSDLSPTEQLFSYLSIN